MEIVSAIYFLKEEIIIHNIESIDAQTIAGAETEQ